MKYVMVTVIKNEYTYISILESESERYGTFRYAFEIVTKPGLIDRILGKTYEDKVNSLIKRMQKKADVMNCLK